MTALLVSHPNSSGDIAALLAELLDRAKFESTGTDPLREALIRIAARYGEVVTASLNAAPARHLDALAELLGQHGREPAAARVHLSFKPTASPRPDVVPLPAHTRVAGKPSGSGEPPVFETLTDLDLVRVEPLLALLFDGGHRSFSKVEIANLQPNLPTAVPYELHIAHNSAFGLQQLRQVKLGLGVRNPGLLPGQLDWIVRAPDGDRILQVQSDATGGLKQSGETVLVAPAEWPLTKVNGVEARWLTLRLRPDPAAPARWRPPRLDAAAIRVVAEIAAQPVTEAFFDGMPLDTSKDFLPFGDRPRFGSSMQLICPVFGEPGAKIELQVQLTNPAGATTSPIPPVTRERNPVIVWEISTASGASAVAAMDGTRSLTQSGSVSFVVPDDAAPARIAGKTAAWLRARLAGGHYGSIVPADGPPIPIPLAPALKSITVHSTIERGPMQPEHLVSQGALTTRQLDPALPVPYDAFPTADVDGPALYIGLAPLGVLDPRDVLAKGRSLAWHVHPNLPSPPLVYQDATPLPDAPRWQMLCGDGWRDMATRDGSDGLTRSGIVEVSVPERPAWWEDITLDKPASQLAWLRIVWPGDREPRLPLALTINTVAARHSQLLRNEIVGSSAGRPDQAFQALRTPIICPVRLQVRETEEDWVDWTEVDSLVTAEHSSRYFTLDRATGEIRFGDGRNGRIPPAGPNNIRLLHYTTGGGRAGNQPLEAVTQLRSAVPAVESVTNHEPATGGLDADDPATVRARASVWLRHRGRAVCIDDYADLALQASAQVARAFCVSGRDLGAAIETGTLDSIAPGVVSVIVIPHGADPAPQPKIDLLATVKTYLDERRLPLGRLVIVGPSYSLVSVRIQVAPADSWSGDEGAAACRERVAAFLHPVTGGADQSGWAVGQRPHRSDIFGLLSAMDSVGFVRSLSMSIDRPAAMPIVIAAGAIDVSPCDTP